MKEEIKSVGYETTNIVAAPNINIVDYGVSNIEIPGISRIHIDTQDVIEYDTLFCSLLKKKIKL